MINYSLDKENAIIHVCPSGPLTKADFDRLATEIDPYIEETGGLAGLILEIKMFPGWESFGAAVHHLRFVRNHHQKIQKVAVVTDTFVGTLAEQLVAHFISAQIKRFDLDQLVAARDWVTEPD